MFFSEFAEGDCSVCGKHFKNNMRRKNIAKDRDDNKLYCKSCALDKVWNEVMHPIREISDATD